MGIPSRFISVDDHVQEHPGVWKDRLSKAKWGDRIPHLKETQDGCQFWVVDGQRIPLRGVALAGAVMPDRGTEPERWEHVPRATYVPVERLRAMDADGVECSVLYPTIAGLAGETFGRIKDSDFELACVQAYNDWVIEEWSAASERFVPQCIVPLSPIVATIKEIRRAVARGHRGVIYPAVPMHLRELPHINEPDYDPIWATCEELSVPLCFHAGSSRAIQFPAYEGFSTNLAEALCAVTRSASSILIVANFLFSKILLRHPRLKVIFAESALGWGAYELEFVDHQFEADRVSREGYPLRPSEMFRRQCYLTGWYDWAGVQWCQHIGVDNILWATNFPMADSSWPNSMSTIERCFQGVQEEKKGKILRGNAATLYNLPSSADGFGASRQGDE